MDKNRKKKTVLAVCFVVICGVVCLWIHYGGQRKEQIVLEKQTETRPVQKAETVTATPGEKDTEQSAVRETPEELYIHVCGAVATEGLYVLPPGSRVADGIAAAGGFCEMADTAYHNLASLLSDGQKIYVPTLAETEHLSVSERGAAAGKETEVSKTSASGPNGKVNLNTAGAEELMTLDGIGAAKAERILQYREKVGAFQSIEELMNVSGIGEAMFERVKEDITAE